MARSLDILKELEAIGALGISNVSEAPKTSVSVKPVVAVIEKPVVIYDSKPILERQAVTQMAESLAHGFYDLQESLKNLLDLCTSAREYFERFSENQKAEEASDRYSSESASDFGETGNSETPGDATDGEDVEELLNYALTDEPEDDEQNAEEVLVPQNFSDLESGEIAALGEEGVSALEAEHKKRKEGVRSAPSKEAKSLDQIKKKFLEPDSIILSKMNGSLGEADNSQVKEIGHD